MSRWGLVDSDNLGCLCGETQTMTHFASCPAYPNTCTRLEDLMAATNNAVKGATFWSASS